MALIVFYEKPGCVNGEKQKAILRRAGHQLRCVDLLAHPWTREELLPFVAGKTPAAMLNATAPAIKSGALDPHALTFAQALALMLATPLLIRRPLIEVDGLRLQGFDDPGLWPYLGDWDGREDVLTCPNLLAPSCDQQR